MPPGTDLVRAFAGAAIHLCGSGWQAAACFAYRASEMPVFEYVNVECAGFFNLAGMYHFCTLGDLLVMIFRVVIGRGLRAISLNLLGVYVPYVVGNFSAKVLVLYTGL